MHERRERPEPESVRAMRRAAEGRDRHGLKQVAVACVIIFGGLGALIALETAFLTPRETNATVTGLSDRWAGGRHHDCVTDLWTGFGEAKIYARAFYRDLPWHVGDRADVTARRTRLTQTIAIETRGTIFARGYGYLPSS